MVPLVAISKWVISYIPSIRSSVVRSVVVLVHNNKDKWLGIWHFAFVSGIRSGVQSKEARERMTGFLALYDAIASSAPTAGGGMVPTTI